MMIVINKQPIFDTFGFAPKTEIAEAIGVSRHTVTAWLDGQPDRIELGTLEKFARACNVEPGAFFLMADELEVSQ